MFRNVATTLTAAVLDLGDTKSYILIYLGLIYFKIYIAIFFHKLRANVEPKLLKKTAKGQHDLEGWEKY